MGHPMVPKINIAVRSSAAQGPRRVPLPSNAAAGGVPSPAVGARALRQRDPLRVVPLDTPELLLRHPRETARHDRSGSDTPAVARSRRLELQLHAGRPPARRAARRGPPVAPDPFPGASCPPVHRENPHRSRPRLRVSGRVPPRGGMRTHGEPILMSPSGDFLHAWEPNRVCPRIPRHAYCGTRIRVSETPCETPRRRNPNRVCPRIPLGPKIPFV